MSEKNLGQLYFKVEPNLILDASGNNLSHCPIPSSEKRGMVAHNLIELSLVIPFSRFVFRAAFLKAALIISQRFL